MSVSVSTLPPPPRVALRPLPPLPLPRPLRFHGKATQPRRPQRAALREDNAPPIAFARNSDSPMRRLVGIGRLWRGLHQTSGWLALLATAATTLLAATAQSQAVVQAAATAAALLAVAHLGSAPHAAMERRLARVRRLVAEGRSGAAIAEAEAILKAPCEAHNLALALELQARAWTSLGEASEARRALASMPAGFSASPGLRGAVLLLEGRLDDARTQLESALAERPDDAVARALSVLFDDSNAGADNAGTGNAGTSSDGT